MSRKPLIAGNWKMNLNHAEAVTLVQKLAWTLDDANFNFSATEVAVFPPFTDIRSVQTLVEGDKLDILYGGQDLSVHDSGAYTGEISGAFLSKLGATFVLVGHSERRTYHHESDELCAAKVQAAYKHGLTPVLCAPRNPRSRHPRRVHPRAAARLHRRSDRRAGRDPGCCLRARLGNRYRQGRNRRRRTGNVRSNPRRNR